MPKEFVERIIVTGGSSGLGKELCRFLAGWHPGSVVYDFSLHPRIDVGYPFIHCEVDVRDPQSIFSGLEVVDGPVDIVVNCAGVNFIEWHEDTPLEEWDRLMNTNARSMWLLPKLLIEKKLINNPATIVNIISNASHIPMTNSAAYNASKGAAHILTLQMARELLKRHGITVFGVSPNKMHSTEMSAYIKGRVCDLRDWTPEEAEEYQKAALPAGEETDPEACAEFIAWLLSTRTRHKFLHGCILPYGA